MVSMLSIIIALSKNLHLICNVLVRELERRKYTIRRSSSGKGIRTSKPIRAINFLILYKIGSIISVTLEMV